MSAQPVLKAESYDVWMRLIIALFGTVAAAGFAVAWRGLIHTSELQLRLVRASEQNLHLKDLSLAAAGLATKRAILSISFAPGPDHRQTG